MRILGIVLFASCFHFSQALFSQQFEGGFFAGITASQIDGDLLSGYNKLGLSAGAYFTRSINRKIIYKSELRYIQKGARTKNTVSTQSILNTTLHYTEFPLILQYYFNKKLFAEAGLVPEILLFARREEDGLPVDNISPHFHRFTVEGTTGAGYFFTDNLAAGFRYSYSLLPARNHFAGQTYRFNRGEYNNIICFTFYYHFP
jgi:hypothetical protein